MQISPPVFLPTGSDQFSEHVVPATKEAVRPSSAERDQVDLSLNLRSMLAQIKGSCLSYQIGQEYFAMSNPGGRMSIHLKRQASIQHQEQRMQLEMEIYADEVGLSNSDLNNAKPIYFTLHLQQNAFKKQYASQAQVVRPLRTIQELLSDLTSALHEIFSKPGNKSIVFSMDEEALAILFGDTKYSRLMEELLVMLRTISALRLDNGRLDQYLVTLSGKGRPYLDVSEDLKIESSGLSVDVCLTILPQRVDHTKNEEESPRQD